MSEISIPFTPQMKEAVLSGSKTATTRTKQYGKRGDTFRLSNESFTLTAVRRVLLGQVAYKFFLQEGFNSPESFIEYWKKLHPGPDYIYHQKVFLHLFEKGVNNGNTAASNMCYLWKESYNRRLYCPDRKWWKQHSFFL